MASTLISRRPPSPQKRLTPSFPTPESLFFPIAPANDPSNESVIAHSNPLDLAFARVDASLGHLNRAMAGTLKAALQVANTLGNISPNPFIALVSSSHTTDDMLVSLVDTIDEGLSAFLARGGGGRRQFTSIQPVIRNEPDSEIMSLPNMDQAIPSPEPPFVNSTTTATEPSHRTKRRKTSGKTGSSSSRSSHRSRAVVSSCKERDLDSCCVTNTRTTGTASHILPFSLQGPNEVSFWKFISLFRSTEETTALQHPILGIDGTLDTLRNVWWLSRDVHCLFDKSLITVVPTLTPDQVPYNPDLIRSYTARIEFPRSARDITIAVYTQPTTSAESLQYRTQLAPGHELVLTTPDPMRLPLPHPAIFQLHAICSRVLAAKAAAGHPHPDLANHDEEVDEVAAVYSDACSGDEDDDLTDHQLSGENFIADWIGYDNIPPSHLPSSSSSSDHPTFPQTLKHTSQYNLPSLSFTHDDKLSDDEQPRFSSVVRADLPREMDKRWAIAKSRVGIPLEGERWWVGEGIDC